MNISVWFARSAIRSYVGYVRITKVQIAWVYHRILHRQNYDNNRCGFLSLHYNPTKEI